MGCGGKNCVWRNFTGPSSFYPQNQACKQPPHNSAVRKRLLSDLFVEPMIVLFLWWQMKVM
jgi:hypothetical protein